MMQSLAGEVNTALLATPPRLCDVLQPVELSQPIGNLVPTGERLALALAWLTNLRA